LTCSSDSSAAAAPPALVASSMLVTASSKLVISASGGVPFCRSSSWGECSGAPSLASCEVLQSRISYHKLCGTIACGTIASLLESKRSSPHPLEPTAPW
jgi:hypothetical protein